MVDFINEVEEELRKDSYNALLRRWGPYIAGAAVLIVATAGATEYFKSASDRKAKSTSISYFNAQSLIDEEKPTEAYTQFMAIADKADAGYAGLSLLNASALKLEQGESLEAVDLLDRAAALFEKDRHKHLAQLKAAYILADLGQYEGLSARLEPLAQRDAPYEYLARELQGFTSLNTDDIRGARGHFAYLATSLDVTPGVQQRAEQVLALTPALSNMTPAEIEAAAQDAAPKDEAETPAQTPDMDAPDPAVPTDETPSE